MEILGGIHVYTYVVDVHSKLSGREIKTTIRKKKDYDLN